MGWLDNIVRAVERAVEEVVEDTETIIDRWETK